MKTVVGRRPSVVGRTVPASNPFRCHVLLLTLLFCLCAGCTTKPPVRVSISGNTARVDVHTDGEYGTEISRLRLENVQTHTTVWELKANSRNPVLGAFILKEGDNPASLYSPGGTYEIVVPTGSNVFRLDRGVEYELSLWKEPDSAPRRVTIQFPKQGGETARTPGTCVPEPPPVTFVC